MKFPLGLRRLALLPGGWFIAGMRWRAILLALLAGLLLLAGATYLLRERLTDQWIQARLAARLSGALGAEVEVQGVAWRSGVLRARSLRIAGGELPFEELEARGIEAAVGWDALLEPAEEPLHVRADEADVVWRDRPAPAGQASTAPPVDVLVTRLNFRHRDAAEWSIEESSVHALNRDGKWSFSGQGGSLQLPGIGRLAIGKFSADHADGRWRIGSFDLRDSRGGAVAGSAAHDAGGSWSGEFSWQNIDIAPFLPGTVNAHIEGAADGGGVLRGGTLTGKMKLTGARTKAVGLLVKLAGLVDREDWSTVPWRTFQFDFTRQADGRLDFSDLQAFSPKGVAVRGEGYYEPEEIGADLQFGVRREGRPYLAALMPVLFSHEREGYLWTAVKVGGTPGAPKENLSARVAAALAVVPATGVIDSAVEAPAAAGEAAEDVLRSMLRRGGPPETSPAGAGRGAP